jgi:predicted RNA-binding Zn ribbon-like protein
MHEERRLNPAVARRFRSGRPALDFVHTGGVGAWTAAELVHDGPTLARWLAHVVPLPESDIRTYDVDVPAARELREAIWQLAQACIAERDFGPEYVATVNRFAAAADPVPLLYPNGTSMLRALDAPAALSILARDAIDLFGGPLARRVRVCAAEDCGLLFVDASRPGTRRWCSMQRCGNLAKVRKHRSAAGAAKTAGGNDDCGPPPASLPPADAFETCRSQRTN